jgi:tetratricopeptide (TPR) repeat protein
MKRFTISVITTICFFAVSAQPNCEIYKQDDPCYRACQAATEGGQLPQGSRKSQLLFDEAIQLCPSLGYAYFEKAVPYLKRGEFITWKSLIDKAVELSPIEYLGYRGWCRYQFLRDYEGAIEDIDRLTGIVGSPNVGYSANGDYQLTIAKALCYKAIGEKEKAITTIEDQLKNQQYSAGIYDYLHLGVLKLEMNDLTGAFAALEKQIQTNDYLADTYYYLAIVYEKLGQSERGKANLIKAKDYYQRKYHRLDPYTTPMDKVFLSQIERELQKFD